MVRTEVENILNSHIDKSLVTRLLDNYDIAAKHIRSANYTDGLVAAGRFSESVYIILHWKLTGTIDFGVSDNSLFDELKKDKSLSESERTHIYRAARDISLLRNRKQGAHESDIDPTELDAAYVMHTMGWILAELVRIHHSEGDVEVARKLVNSLAKREVPFIEDIDGYPVLLKRDMSQTDQVLLVMYHVKQDSYSSNEIADKLSGQLDARQVSKALFNLATRRMVFKNPKTGSYTITSNGIVEVEEKILKR